MSTEVLRLLPFNLPLTCLCSLSFYSMCLLFLRPRSANTMVKYCFIACYSLWLSVVSPMLPQVYRLVQISMLILTLPFLMFRGSVGAHLLTSAIWITAIIVSDSFSVLPAIPLGWDMTAPTATQTLLFTAISTLCMAVFTMILRRVRGVLSLGPDRRMRFGVAVSCLSAVILSGISVVGLEYALPSRYLTYLNLISVYFPFLFMLLLLDRIASYLRDAEAASVSEHRAREQLAHSRALIAENEALRALRHDMNNHLMGISSLAERGELDRQAAYIQELLQTLEGTRSAQAPAESPSADPD